MSMRTTSATALLCAALSWGALADEPQPVPPAAESAQAEAAARPEGEAPAATPDDPDSQESIDRGAEELEALRAAEEKAGLLPSLPGAGPRDGLAVGMSAWNPLARDLQAAIGTSSVGAPLAEPLATFSGEVALAELSGISAAELKAKYDIPVELNEAVVAYIRFFQTDARPHFERWLARSGRWLPSMRAILEAEGMPLDLVYLSMIESGFNAYAYSPAKASGLWQFVVGTSRRYGLVTDFWIDERRDPLKATQAAARYLADLRERFHGDWYLAWAGYNAGEGKIEKAIRKEATVDFWRMSSKGRTLRAETKHYVPKLIAAALIAKHPERFGFKVELEPAFAADEVFVPEATDLRALAKAAGASVETLRELNPSLRRFCTPPGGYRLRLPVGEADAFTVALESMDPEERLSFAQHKLERGESLAKLARAYGVTEAALLKTNGLKSHKQVKNGMVLVVPLKGSRGLVAGEKLEGKKTSFGTYGRTVTATPSANYAQVRKARERALAAGQADPAEAAARREEQARVAAAKAAAERRARLAGAHGTQGGHAASAVAKAGVYVVQPGDSLWTIASKLGVSVDALAKINGLNKRKARALQVGQTLAVKAS